MFTCAIIGVLVLLEGFLLCSDALRVSRSRLSMMDYPKPPNIEFTANFIEAEKLSQKFQQILHVKSTATPKKKKTVVVIGGGLSGLACGKYIADAGHKAIVLEARDVLGGKVSAWKDKDGDWIETGLHIFFGAYPNMMNLFKELNIENRLQWKKHQMVFAMQELPGEFTTFDFIPGIPAPFNFALAILQNQKMLSLIEKLQIVPALIPMLIEGQSFIDEQDEKSVSTFMADYGMPERVNQEIFVAMAKALDFIDPDKLSMTVVLTAMNRFINEADGSQIAFLDGNQPDRLCAPIKEHIEAQGGEVRLNSPVQEIVTVDSSPSSPIKHLVLRNGDIIEADEYVSAMPVDLMRRYVPPAWSQQPFFRQFDELEGIPVINIHIWFDRKLSSVDQLCFSRSPLLSVYADMSTTCKEYYNEHNSMLEFVFAPCSLLAGGDSNWISKSDEEILQATLGELARLFPSEIAVDNSKAKVEKYAIVRVPRSVYAAIPGRNKFRPSQRTPVPNFTLAGDWTYQKFLGSMEGAVLAGKLAAEVVCTRLIAAEGDTAANRDRSRDIDDRHSAGVKAVHESVLSQQDSWRVRAPTPVYGQGAIAYGGGAELKNTREETR